MVTHGVATPMVGETYSLTCNVSGAERIMNSIITYRWLRDGIVVTNQTMATLFFTFLTFSDAGQYICEATVESSFISSPIIAMASTSIVLEITPTTTASAFIPTQSPTIPTPSGIAHTVVL